MHRFPCGLIFMIGLSSWYQDLKAFNVSTVSFFFTLNIFDPNCIYECQHRYSGFLSKVTISDLPYTWYIQEPGQIFWFRIKVDKQSLTYLNYDAYERQCRYSGFVSKMTKKSPDLPYIWYIQEPVQIFWLCIKVDKQSLTYLIYGTNKSQHRYSGIVSKLTNNLWPTLYMIHIRASADVLGFVSKLTISDLPYIWYIYEDQHRYSGFVSKLTISDLPYIWYIYENQHRYSGIVSKLTISDLPYIWYIRQPA